MIRNPNYRPHYGFLEEVDAVKMAREKYERYIDPRDPDYIAPEVYCPKCEDHTTLITAHGECKVCGTEVRK